MNLHRLGLALFVGASIVAFANVVVAWLMAVAACAVLAREMATRRAAAISLAILVVSAIVAVALNGVQVGAFGRPLFSTEATSAGGLAGTAALIGMAAPWLATAWFAISQTHSRRLAVIGAVIVVVFEAIPITAILIYSALNDGALAPSWLFAAQAPAIVGLGLILAGLARDWRMAAKPAASA